MTDNIEPKKIMVIEDNKLNQKIAAMIIKQLGHDVIQIFESKTAVEAIEKERPDLIILDILMPEVSGVDICRNIKSNNELKHIPVIVVTSLSSEEDKKHISESGCDNYIAKPFLPHIFAQSVAKYIPVKTVDWQ
ncbi:MAG: two component response regulator [Rickettsiaceae bacterium]|jgi:two-component system cell cycle response regulator DivK|nr:two component response regulator [Rickettsiaceae bacterium]